MFRALRMWDKRVDVPTCSGVAFNVRTCSELVTGTRKLLFEIHLDLCSCHKLRANSAQIRCINGWNSGNACCVAACCCLLHVAASYVKPFQNMCSRNATFACRKASTNITNPSGVAHFFFRTPTVAFGGSCAQTWQGHMPIFMLLWLDWWWFLDQGLDNFLKSQNVLNCYRFFCNLTLSRCTWFYPFATKKLIPNCNLSFV